MVFLESRVCWVVYTKFTEGSSRNYIWTLRFFVLDHTRYYRSIRPLTPIKIRAIYRILTKKIQKYFYDF